VRRVLLDVNVLLDAILGRLPHADAATKLWAAVEAKQMTGLVPAHGVTTLFYLVARRKGAPSARRAVGQLLTVFGVAEVDQAVLRRGLALSWTDFEDAVCAAAAEAAGCDLIVTRDPSGFRDSPVSAVDPATALALMDRGGGPRRVSERTQSYGTGRKVETARRHGASHPGRRRR